MVSNKHSQSNPVPVPTNTTNTSSNIPFETSAKLQLSNSPSNLTKLTATTTTQPDINSRADVPHNFFYSTLRLQVRCKDAEWYRTGRWWMLEGAPGVDPSEVIDFINGGLRPAQINEEILGIRRSQLRCKNGCKCDEDGNIVENLDAPMIRSRRQCNAADHIPNKCVALWGCSCETNLRQPQPSISGASVEDYQRALDRIPAVVQINNPHYQWENAPGGRPLRFTTTHYFTPAEHDQWEAPESTPDSPIFLEGPTRKKSPSVFSDAEDEDDEEEEDVPLWSPGTPDKYFWHRHPGKEDDDDDDESGTGAGGGWHYHIPGDGSLLGNDWGGPGYKRDTIPNPKSNNAESAATDDL